MSSLIIALIILIAVNVVQAIIILKLYLIHFNDNNINKKYFRRRH